MTRTLAADAPAALASEEPWGLGGFLPYRLSIASNAVSSLIAERYRKRFGLKIPEWRVMAVLGDAGGPVGRTQRDLTRATLMDKVAVNRACKVLEQRGLVARAANEADGRSHLLELTGEGRAVHAEIMPLALATEAELFEGLAPAEQEQMKRLLRRIYERAIALSEDPPEG
ncbi:MAG: MarR family winged helix-turn-helix transcriptional regulator [Erythrobacter sp.]|uniref:MarR family winged helix-turn-helix transcriptional regulator n=1 Tax=Erythrobacter sp. HL-111 TaxID=1798193 RepID=UPI0006DA0E68|nr:MarR family winged helix-turn-helix transcriptional regulator [Erythrobacter sp. HL-111]KPP89768.1 MAG: transcriptional regulator [Erythrobacteraceae bacterium HL-111]SDT10660.1 transcriptional regulator, MarR family [Erythrobacter sp. HL-111]